MNKVTFVQNSIVVNGTHVGNLSCGGGEVWVDLFNSKGECKFAGRFKRFSPKTQAKRYIKWCLERFSAEEVIAGCESDSPYGWAQSKGFDPLTKKQRADVEKWAAM
jgi:hypothetical protein